MPKLTAKKGKGNKDLVIVNLQRTPLDKYATLRIFATVDVVMEGLMKRLELKIPKFRLNRYMKVKMMMMDEKKMMISGIEKGTAGQQIPATVFKSIECENVVCIDEPFVIDVNKK